MKKVQKFVAKNGAEFESEKECIRYETILLKLDKIFAMFPELPKDHWRFKNGTGYIQHSRKTYDHVVKEFTKLACQFHKGLSEYPYNSYRFWRYLNDNESIFYSYGQRLTNIDEATLREYGQGYYKIHPGEITGGQIN